MSTLPVGVVGAGAMGSGIAQVAALAGHPVLLGDVNADAATRGRESIGKSLAREVEKGRLTDAESVLARITIAHETAEYATCGLVIEAIAESLALKTDLFRSLEQVVSSDCILATNTSSLSVSAIAGTLRHAERAIGIHFFNPATVLPLVEIVPALQTSPDVTAKARSLIDGWKKTTVVASDTPGFIVNRIARPFYGESLRQYEEGIASIATIDWAMREHGGFRMGPFELMDFIGNDINFAVTKSVFEGFFFDPRYRPALTQKRLVDAGLFGRKSKRGYFDYREGAAKPEALQDHELGKRIVERTLAMLVNEAADAVHMQVASPADIELSMTKGVNYPRGLLAWGNEIGPSAILATIERLQAEYGEDRYRASPLLRRCVENTQPLPT